MPLAHIIPRRRGAPPLLISPALLLLPLMQPFLLVLYTWSFVVTLAGVLMFLVVSKFPS